MFEAILKARKAYRTGKSLAHGTKRARQRACSLVRPLRDGDGHGKAGGGTLAEHNRCNWPNMRRLREIPAVPPR